MVERYEKIWIKYLLIQYSVIILRVKYGRCILYIYMWSSPLSVSMSMASIVHAIDPSTRGIRDLQLLIIEKQTEKFLCRMFESTYIEMTNYMTTTSIAPASAPAPAVLVLVFTTHGCERRGSEGMTEREPIL